MTGRRRQRRRRVVAADVHHVRTAGVEAAAARRVQQRRRRARDRRQAAAVRARRHRAEQAPGVGVLRALEDVVDDARSRRPGRAYITSTSSQISATTPRSCVIMMIAESNSCRKLADEVEDLRLRRHVERRRGLVGDQQVGVVHQRHRDHHALAHAARELVRVALAAAPRAAGCRPPRASRGRAPARLARRDVAVLAGPPPRAGARSCTPGSARSSGSWKIIAMSSPRILRSSSGSSVSRSLPSNSTSPLILVR